MTSEWREWQEIEEIEHYERRIERKLDLLIKVLVPPEPATKGTVFQIEGGMEMPITKVNVGGVGVFQVVWNGGMDPTKQPTWASKDTGIAFSPVPTDPTGNTEQAQDAVLDANPSFDIVVTGTASDGSTVTATATVPLAQAPATSGVINQLS